ncbi:MAG: phospholipase D/Transphosphatidylase [Cyanobacteria bacterium RYN_339]|nr:phospholipase D/Transphosphatidylase [Cyanobacteria bacterium RYN_339]
MTMRALISTVCAALLLSACGTQTGLRATGAATGDLAAAGLMESLVDRVIVPEHPQRPPQNFTTGNTARLYVTPAENVPAILELLGSAKESIAIEMYNFIDDTMGHPVADLLVAKAKAGVKVQVLADFAGSNTRRGYGAMAKRFKEAGIELRTYKLRAIIKDDHMVGVNITHRKLYLVDGQRALTGGVNLREPFNTNTQDVLLRWEGPIVPGLYREFGYEWLASGGTAPIPSATAVQAPLGVRAQVAVTSAPEGRYEIRDAVYQAVDAAQSEIRIEQQYLWDDRLMLRIHAALKRGVKVRAIVPGEEDRGVFKYVHSEEMQRLIKDGGECRLYAGDGGTGHLHAKYFGIDDHWVAVGSCNGDTRGFTDNQEIDTIFTDQDLATQLRGRLFETDWTQNTVPFVYKPSSVVVRPFRSLLELIDYFM